MDGSGVSQPCGGRGRGQYLKLTTTQPGSSSSSLQEQLHTSSVENEDGFSKISMSSTASSVSESATSSTTVQSQTEENSSVTSSIDGIYRNLSLSHSPKGVVGSTRGFRRECPVTPTSRPGISSTKRGKAGVPLELKANYFRIEQAASWSLSQYSVKFEPVVESRQLRKALIRRGAGEYFGNAFIYDGDATIFSAVFHPELVLQVGNKDENSPERFFQVKIRRVTEVESGDCMYIQVYNLILRRNLAKMGLTQIGHHFYDLSQAICIDSHYLKLIPGYITSIRNHENSVLLCVETTTKVLRTDTFLDNMNEQRRSAGNYKKVMNELFLGATVLTSYNNKTYTIAEIDWTKNPTSTFERKKSSISYFDYYRDQYNIVIKDLEQPLLITKQRKQDFHRRGPQGAAILVPELCQMTGLNPSMRSNFSLMKELSEHMNLTPEKKVDACMKFIQNFLQNPETQTDLQAWSLRISDKLVECPGRVLPSEKIFFDPSQEPEQVDPKTADWGGAFRRNRKKMRSVAGLKTWTVICPQRDEPAVQNLIRNMQKVASSLGMPIPVPDQVIKLANPTSAAYSQGITSLTSGRGKKNDVIFIVLANNKPELYSTIKKQLSGELGLVSQCFLAKNLKSKGLMSIATNLVIQINSKLGGEPWTTVIPFKKMMVVGLDVYRGTSLTRNKHISAMVSSVTETQSRFYSAVSFYDSTDELSRCVSADLKKCIDAWVEVNQELPQRILFYRDGVGEGQLDSLMATELKNVQDAIDKIYGDKQCIKPKFTFVVVSKKVNTRLFDVTNARTPANPPPGTVCDDVVTLPERYDFYLIPQTARQGAVSPSAYNVIYDTAGLDPDKIQRLTYKFCHLYYNWSGTVAVPAPCQYAHKLAHLVAVAIGQKAHPELAYNLHFL